jgi:hypothetical protein
MIKRKFVFIVPVLILVFLLFLQCNALNINKKKAENGGNKYIYPVKRSTGLPAINAVWDKEIWDNARSIRLSNFMGERPSHFPETRVKLQYDKDYIYVIFHVKDQYVKAVAKETNGQVWMDSCVEFFFSPGADVERGYFNFEANCKGVYLFEYHLKDGTVKDFVRAEDRTKIEIAHSLKTDVEQEFTQPLEWTLAYRIPVDILKKYMKVDEPGPGVSWRANFYKCADKSSHPHWLTWAPVDYPKPKFHLPEFFGRLEFE